MRAYHWFTTCLIALVGAALLCLLQAPACMADRGAAPPDSVRLQSLSVRGAAVSLITVNLNDPTVRVDIGLPKRGIAHAESFRSLISRHSPLAAVTGTYFDVKTYVPTGSIVVGGKLVHESNIGTAVCFTSTNVVRFIPAKYNRVCDLSGSECAFRTGPRLLANGEYALNPRLEGFRHPGLFGARTRMVLGVTAHNKLLLAFVRTPVTFGRAAGIMKALGAKDAVCLDGGTSSAMYYRGKTVKHPGRLLTNVIVVGRRTLSDIAPGLVASAAGAAPVRAYNVPRHPTAVHPTLSENSRPGYPLIDRRPPVEHAAVLGERLQLRPPKGIHSLFPIHRAKFAGLKGLEYS